MITWDEYQQQALTTAIYPLKRELEYTVLGLCSEVGEIGEAYLRKTTDPAEVLAEIGDNFWYCAAIADALKVPLSLVAQIHPPVSGVYGISELLLQIVSQTSGMAGVVKKSIRDNDGFLSSAGQVKIEEHLNTTLWLLDDLCRRFNTTRTAVMSKNLNKLADRKQRGVLQGSGDNR